MSKTTIHSPVLLLVNFNDSVYDGYVTTFDSEDSHVSNSDWFRVVGKEEEVTPVVGRLKANRGVIPCVVFTKSWHIVTL